MTNEETLAQRDILYKEKLDGLVIKYSEELSDLQLVSDNTPVI